MARKRGLNSYNPSDPDLDPILDDTEDLSASEYPRLSDSDTDADFGFESQDFLGIGDDEDENRSLAKAEAEHKKRMTKIMLVGGAIVAVIVLIVIGMMAAGGSDSGTSSDSGGEAKQGQDSHINGSSKGVTVPEEVGKTYTGTEEGSQANGTGAILAFDYNYYTTRNGSEARKYFNPDASSYDAAFIQGGIDKVPQGTTYKLEITPVNIGSKYDVVLTLNIPGAESVSYNQDTEVMNKDGVYYIKTFTSKKSGDQKK